MYLLWSTPTPPKWALTLSFIQRKFAYVVCSLSPVSQHYFPTYNLLSCVLFYFLFFRRKCWMLSSFAPFLLYYPWEWLRMTNTCLIYIAKQDCFVGIEYYWPYVNLLYWWQLTMCQFVARIQYSWQCINLLWVLHTVGCVSVYYKFLRYMGVC
jgi:hypothetical protein